MIIQVFFSSSFLLVAVIWPQIRSASIDEGRRDELKYITKKREIMTEISRGFLAKSNKREIGCGLIDRQPFAY
jgi:hypothetical protein